MAASALVSQKQKKKSRKKRSLTDQALERVDREPAGEAPESGRLLLGGAGAHNEKRAHRSGMKAGRKKKGTRAAKSVTTRAHVRKLKDGSGS